jgi:hypothetical protein
VSIANGFHQLLADDGKRSSGGFYSPAHFASLLLDAGVAAHYSSPQITDVLGRLNLAGRMIALLRLFCLRR